MCTGLTCCHFQDAVYAVYLKKVRYVPPPGYDGVPRYRAIDPDRPQLQCPCPGSDHLQWESVKERVIKAGTVEKLVECLVGADGTMDSRHFNVFFATYRAFAEPTNVLDRLLRRYESLEKEVNSSTSALVIQNSIRSILICWLDMYPEDFYDPDCDFAMLTNLLDFGQRSKLSDLRAKSRKLLERFKHIQEEGGMIGGYQKL
ncbi:N-terminal Ras-GEF domain-containing protein [Trichostrongylus colubriformis]|uniref:N-terminal Ras-GEF domain-containing protein n=1 Tax=Trichostrongylus colubriformis TaxID=6319 RepID=A0AAN8IRE3_TRICO